MQPRARRLVLAAFFIFLLALYLVPGRSSLGGVDLPTIERGASTVASPLPLDFTPLLSAPGVDAYQKGENEDGLRPLEFVQVVDLSKGARVELLHGPIADHGTGDGIYGGDNPAFSRHYLPTIWQELTQEAPRAFCLSNGGFFRDMVDGVRVDPTELAFPLKKNGVVISEGYGSRLFRRHKVMLEIWPDQARIGPLNRATLYGSSAPQILAGLAESAYVRASERLGRSYLGVGDGNGDGQQELLLIYSSMAATQAQAAATLRAFGAEDVMMVDGGGSTQLLCEGMGYISQSRPLPQTIATVPGPPPGLERWYYFLAEP